MNPAIILRPDHNLPLLSLLRTLLLLNGVHPRPIHNHPVHLFFLNSRLLLQKPLPCLMLSLDLEHFPLFLRLVMRFGLHLNPSFNCSFFLNFLFLQVLQSGVLFLFFGGRELVALVGAPDQRNPVLLPQILRGLRGHQAFLAAEQVQPVLELLQLGVRFFFVQD